MPVRGADLDAAGGVLPMLLFVAVVLGLFIRKLTSEERIQLVHKSVEFTRVGLASVKRFVTATPEGCDDFYTALRERTRWAPVTPVLLAVFVTIYLLMVNGEGTQDAESLIDWGGNIGPRTTNGEWWRLLTAMFVHWGLLHLIATVAGLVQVGRLVERLVGPVAFAFVFIAAGLFSGLRELSVHPVAVTIGPSGGLFGVYALLFAVYVWGWAGRSPLTIPPAVLTRMAPGAVLFFVYHLAAEGFFNESMTWGLAVGLAGGAILAFGIGAHKPGVRRLCTSMAATLAIIVVFAAPLRGMADVSREMASVIELETRTTAVYDAEVARFRNGRQTAEALADLAEAIASDVHATRASLSAITNVPPEHEAVVNDALEYLRLREDSWRLRVEGLRAGRMQMLRQAERVESAAKTLFVRVETLKSGKAEK